MTSRRAAACLVSLCLVVPLLSAPVAMALPRLGKITASISNHYPKQYTYVTAKARTLDSSGHAIKGAKVVFRWYYKSTTPVVTKYTDANGYASCRRNISRAAVGYKVVVKCTGVSGGVTKSASTWFIPKKP